MSETVAETKFREFTEIWGLTHSKPEVKDTKDMIALVSVRIALLGAMGLSGTRTGSMVAETKQLSRFMGTLGVTSEHLWMFDGVESILAFLTIEVTLFLAGYLLGDRQTTDKKWYLYFMLAGILPAVVSNLGPAFHLLGDGFYQFWLVVVNVVIGLATISLALIAGRVMAVIENEFKVKFSKAKIEWLKARNVAWSRSTQYRDVKNGLIETGLEKPTLEQILQTILMANGATSNIETIVKESGLKQNEVMKGLKRLQKKKQLKVDGMTITMFTPDPT